LHDIALVVPTNDRELPILARHRREFAEHGIVVAVSDPKFTDIARDRRMAAEWFREHDLRTPRPVHSRLDAKFPLFAQHCNGLLSGRSQLVTSASQLAAQLLDDPEVLFTEYLSPQHFDEYTLDMYYSNDGELRCIVPRLRIEARGGEVSKGRTARIPAMSMLRARFGRIPGARGCITMKISIHRQTEAIYGMDIKARFGGGYPLSYEAGANFPRWLIEEHFFGVPTDYFDAWETDLTMLRYDEHVVVRIPAA
jgi:carbamoyl-phosphate synthase large subunit